MDATIPFLNQLFCQSVYTLCQTVFTITDSPRNIRLDPEQYLLGGTITCTAEGNPDPEYIWINTNTSTVIATGPRLTIGTDMSVDHLYLCMAQNVYGSVNSSTFSIDIPGMFILIWCTYQYNKNHSD